MNKVLCYIYKDHLYMIKLYNKTDDNNQYIPVYVDNNLFYIPIVELSNEQASHIRIYINNRELALAFEVI